MSPSKTVLAVSVIAGALAAPSSSALAQAVGNGHHPVWAPDGRIYLHGVHGQDVSAYSVDAEGSDLRRVTTSAGRRTTGTASGQQAPDPCATEVARQFDFWIGEWTVTQQIATRDGGWETYAARSTVTPALDGCALVERWEGTVRFFREGMTEPESLVGLSVRAPGPDGSWRINWMDSRDPTFGAPWVGGFESGEGTFLRSTDAGTLTRIRFFDITETSVEWELAVSADGGSRWAPLWKMHFRRMR